MKIKLQNASSHVVAASYSEEGEVEHINSMAQCFKL